jgi:hypothetical protein
MAMTILEGCTDRVLAFEFLNLYLKYGKKILGDLMTEAAFQVCKRKDTLAMDLRKMPFFQNGDYMMHPEYRSLVLALHNAGRGMSCTSIKRNMSDWNHETLDISLNHPFVVYEPAVAVWVPLGSEPTFVLLEPANDLPEDVEIIGPDAPAVKPQA